MSRKWYYRRHGRRGTLWMDWFKSVLVEGSRRKKEGLRVMALYIDLNYPSFLRLCGVALRG